MATVTTACFHLDILIMWIYGAAVPIPILVPSSAVPLLHKLGWRHTCLRAKLSFLLYILRHNTGRGSWSELWTWGRAGLWTQSCSLPWMDFLSLLASTTYKRQEVIPTMILPWTMHIHWCLWRTMEMVFPLKSDLILAVVFSGSWELE